MACHQDAESQAFGTPSKRVSEWVALLHRSLDGNADFTRMFERTPGKALHTIGVPYDDVVAVLAEWQGLVEAVQNDEGRT